MSVLHNVVKTPATKIEVRPGMFKVTSRTDIPAEPEAPRRTAPMKCPICGTRASSHPGLFTQVGNLFKCNVCDTQISESGTVVVNGVF